MVSDSIRIGKGLFAFSFPCDSIYSRVMKWPCCKVNQPLKIMPLSLLPAEETLQGTWKIAALLSQKGSSNECDKRLIGRKLLASAGKDFVRDFGKDLSCRSMSIQSRLAVLHWV